MWTFFTRPRVLEDAADGRADLQALLIAEERRLQHENLAWQVPVISFTAQSFLLTLIFSSSTAPVGRVVASGIGLASAIAVLHYFLRCLYKEHIWAYLVEARLGALGQPTLHWRGALEEATGGVHPWDGTLWGRLNDRFAGRRGRRGLAIWVALLALITAVDLFLVLETTREWAAQGFSLTIAA